VRASKELLARQGVVMQELRERCEQSEKRQGSLKLAIESSEAERKELQAATSELTARCQALAGENERLKREHASVRDKLGILISPSSSPHTHVVGLARCLILFPYTVMTRFIACSAIPTYILACSPGHAIFLVDPHIYPITQEPLICASNHFIAM